MHARRLHPQPAGEDTASETRAPPPAEAARAGRRTTRIHNVLHRPRPSTAHGPRPQCARHASTTPSSRPPSIRGSRASSSAPAQAPRAPTPAPRHLHHPHRDEAGVHDGPPRPHASAASTPYTRLRRAYAAPPPPTPTPTPAPTPAHAEHPHKGAHLHCTCIQNAHPRAPTTPHCTREEGLRSLLTYARVRCASARSTPARPPLISSRPSAPPAAHRRCTTHRPLTHLRHSPLGMVHPPRRSPVIATHAACASAPRARASSPRLASTPPLDAYTLHRRDVRRCTTHPRDTRPPAGCMRARVRKTPRNAHARRATS
ncbi:hypothetical protein DFH09DRAFT_1345395 [Mycena vulgaris]|nr:hypothetical protein DFH09DRAFT_1345395 [Mycena vulgaris]